MTDIEIAQAANPLKIGEIAQAAGVDEKYLEEIIRQRLTTVF